MRPLATLAPLGPLAAQAAAGLDGLQLACDVLPAGDELFRCMKAREAGALSFVLLDDGEEPSLAAAVKAASLLRHRGAERVILVAARGAMAIAGRTRLFAVEPRGVTLADAVRCWLEPLAIFGLVGVERSELFALQGTHGSVCKLDEATPPAPEAVSALLTCRLRPTAALAEIEAAASHARALAPQADVLVTGPEVEDGPAALICFNFQEPGSSSGL